MNGRRLAFWRDVFSIVLPLTMLIALGADAVDRGDNGEMGVALVFAGVTAWNAQDIVRRRMAKDR